MAQHWVDNDADNSWNSVNNWASTSGGSDNTGPPSAGDDVIFDSGNVTNCTVDIATPELLSITMGGTASGVYSGTITASNKVQMTGAMVIESGCTGTLDMNADIDIDGDFTGDGATVLCGSGDWTIGGNFDNKDVTTWTQETSTIIMTGTAKTMIGKYDKDLRGLTITGTISISSSTSTFIDVYGPFTIETGATLTNDTARGINSRNFGLTINGTGVYTGTGTSLNNILAGNISISAGGEFSLNNVVIRNSTITNSGTFAPTTAKAAQNITLGAGTYGGAWTFTGEAATRTVTINGNVVFTGAVSYDATVVGDYTIDNSGNFDTTYQGALTFAQSSGTLNYDNGTGAGTMTFSGTANQAIVTPSGWTDVLDKIVISKTAGDVTGPANGLYAVSFTGTNTGTGTYDPNGGLHDFTGNCSWAAAFDFNAAADTMNGSDWQVDGNFTADGQTLNATAGWDLDVTNTAVASGAGEVEYCTAGGTEITATLWTDGSNNTNWDFGGAGPTLPALLEGGVLSGGFQTLGGGL